MRIRLWFAGLLFAATPVVHAALLSVTTEVGWYADKFEEPSSLRVETGFANFVIDTSTPDSDPGAQGLFLGALVSFTMSLDQLNRAPLFFVLAPGPNSIQQFQFAPQGGPDTALQLSLSAYELSGAFGADSLWTFFFRAINIRPPLSDGSLLGAEFWNGAFGYGASAYSPGGGYAVETDWATSFRTTVLVPAPATLALGFVGLIAWCTATRRRRVLRGMS